MDYVIFFVAMTALIYGADFIIKESERIALHFNISHFVIGATLVAFGTSLPEMAASMMASSEGKSEMAVANVVGSVIFNITMVLGIVFLFAKSMNPARNLFAKDSAWVVMPVVVFFLMIQDGNIGRVDGFIFLLMMASYLIFLFSSSKEDLEGEIDESLTKKFNWIKTLVLLSMGFTLTIGGANFVVESATSIARSLNVSEWIIGLFLISLGTSLPELVVSLVALKKGNAELGIGNIIGSNVANFSMVLGASAILNPLSIDLQAAQYDLLIMTSASLALLFILANKLYNKAGAIFLLIILALFMQNSFI
ncbi:calcium/sodium antiporter [Sulfurimonas sp.]|jgi:cation:H+ antiporter|uniref:calcium/sodium antiporter n=1 Tax=Sulfurimonas sp. TaxID=2022749 RepID=UPI0025FF7A84|nr:calcium/sodium antiporter [Sulfurimonas sp.]MBT5935688.1 calcium/sodium antiporter [Sulfurimonas sp.]